MSPAAQSKPTSSAKAKGGAVIKVDSVAKSFDLGANQVQVLQKVSFDINQGEFVVIFGPSGCGKSTLLHTLLGLEVPSEGSVTFLNNNLYNDTTEDDRSDIRKKNVGMVYQQMNWIKSMTVGENVAFPLMLLGKDKSEALETARKLLSNVGMDKWIDYIPTELSGGMQQRVALARALINEPQLIVADEPTGNLDYESGETVMNLLSELNTEKNMTVIMVTHDLVYLKYATKAIRMFDGEVVGIEVGQELKKIVDDLPKHQGLNKVASNLESDPKKAQKSDSTAAAPDSEESSQQDDLKPPATRDVDPHEDDELEQPSADQAQSTPKKSSSKEIRETQDDLQEKPAAPTKKASQKNKSSKKEDAASKSEVEKAATDEGVAAPTRVLKDVEL